MKKLILITAYLLLAVPCTAEIIIVDEDWPYDFNNIQAAIDYSSPGDFIIVFPGTYTGPGNRDIDFLGKAVTVSSIDPTNPMWVANTIIDCNYTGGQPYSGFIFNSDEDANSVLAGFTITKAAPAVVCLGSSPTISNCVITANSYVQYGVILIIEDSGPTIKNCTIADNYGSGVSCDYNFDNNPVIENCTITGNTGYGRSGSTSGGGISVFQGLCIVHNSVITGNNVDRYGGGIWCESDASMEITDCIIAGNTAGYDGGGIYYVGEGGLNITNSTIAGNYAEGQGGGIFAGSSSQTSITSSIIWGNTIGYIDPYSQIFGDPQVWFSCIQDDDPNDSEIPFGEDRGNIDDDPCFVQPGYWDANNWVQGDYHLLASSPCIEAGDPIPSYSGQTDIDGQPRVMGQYVDIGADEFELSMIIVTKPQGGEVWAAGSTHQIEWDSYNITGTVDIGYSTDYNDPCWGGVLVWIVESNVPDTGSYTWNIPSGIDSSSVRVWIRPNTPQTNFIRTRSGFFTVHPDSTGPPVASPWKSLGGDYDRTGLGENVGPQVGCVKWQFQTTQPVSASPTVGADGQIHLACEDGNLYTLDPNGQLLWSYDTNSPLLSSPSIGPDGSVFVGAQNGKLYAIDVNGNLRWTHRTDGFIYSSPAVSSDGDIYACSQDGKLYALAQDGSELWTFQVAGPGVASGAIFASPAIGLDGTVYLAGFYDPNLYALDPNTGSVKWNCDFSQFLEPNEWEPNYLIPWIFASPVVAQDGTIYQTLIYNPEQLREDPLPLSDVRPFWYDSKLYSIDPNNGTVLWSTNMTETPKHAEEPFPPEPNYWFRKFYVKDAPVPPYPFTETYISAHVRRYYRVNNSSWSDPVLAPDGTIYANYNDQYLRAVDPNGTIKWVTSLGWFGGFTMTVGSDGLVYAASDEGYLSVVDPNGKEVARFESDGRLTFPVINADNSILICDSENIVWSLSNNDCQGQTAALHRPQDLNTDWSTNLSDFALMADSWLDCTDTSYDPVTDAPYCYDDDNEIFLVGDINRDQFVNLDDLAEIADKWLNQE